MYCNNKYSKPLWILILWFLIRLCSERGTTIMDEACDVPAGVGLEERAYDDLWNFPSASGSLLGIARTCNETKAVACLMNRQDGSSTV